MAFVLPVVALSGSADMNVSLHAMRTAAVRVAAHFGPVTVRQTRNLSFFGTVQAVSRCFSFEKSFLGRQQGVIPSVQQLHGARPCVATSNLDPDPTQDHEQVERDGREMDTEEQVEIERGVGAGAGIGEYSIMTFYKLTALEDAAAETARHRAFLEPLDVTGRIYIAPQGINAQMSGAAADCAAYMAWLQTDPRFADTNFVVSPHHEHVFPRLTIKLKKQLVASFQGPVDLGNRGQYMTPAEWRRTLAGDTDGSDYVLVDVRNQYEWQVGHFVSDAVQSVELPACTSFSEFPSYAQHLKDKIDPSKTKLMMCCTGGIRCEIFSAYLRENGFEHVFQLQGGIINYGLNEGDANWVGKLFVFDDRLTVPVGASASTSSEPSTDDDSSDDGMGVVEFSMAGPSKASSRLPESSRCLHCAAPVDTYVTCANTDCNRLFLCCDACLHAHRRCCCPECSTAPRVRPFTDPKPFRRLGNYGLSRNRSCTRDAPSTTTPSPAPVMAAADSSPP